MHAWLPASLAADVTVTAHAAAFAAETGDSCRWRSPAGRPSKSLNTTEQNEAACGVVGAPG